MNLGDRPETDLRQTRSIGGVGCGVWILGFNVVGSVWGLDVRAEGSTFRVQCGV